MDLLSLFASCGLFVSAACHPPPQTGKTVEQWRPAVARAAAQFALPAAWVAAVMKQESGGHTILNGRPITSSAGAMGLMQLMPHTYEDLRRRYGLGTDPYDPDDNIVAGTAYLRQMYERYGYPGMFAAYNAGPGRVDAFLSRHRRLPEETLHYLAAVVPGSESAFGGTEFSANSPPKATSHDAIFVQKSSTGALFVDLSSNHF